MIVFLRYLVFTSFLIFMGKSHAPWLVVGMVESMVMRSLPEKFSRLSKRCRYMDRR